MKKQSIQAGYTLIELLLYISIVGGLLIAITSFFTISTEARIKSQTISEVNQQGRLAIDRISQIVRNASGITAPATGVTGSQLTVTVPTANLSPTVFSLNDTVLQIKEGSAPAEALTNEKVSVTSLTVKNLTKTNSTGIVQVSITITRNNPSDLNIYDYTETFTTSIARRYP